MRRTHFMTLGAISGAHLFGAFPNLIKTNIIMIKYEKK